MQVRRRVHDVVICFFCFRRQGTGLESCFTPAGGPPGQPGLRSLPSRVIGTALRLPCRALVPDSVLLALDVGRLEYRPPRIALSRPESAKRGSRLLIGCRSILTEVRATLLQGGCHSLHGGAVEFGDHIGRLCLLGTHRPFHTET